MPLFVWGARSLAGIGLLLFAVLLVRQAAADEAAASAFGYEVVQARAEQLAAEPYRSPGEVPARLGEIGYDQYHNIRLRREQVIWRDRPGFFSLVPFTAGFIYRTPVAINLVEDGEIVPLSLDAGLYQWPGDEPLVEGPVPLAGFRLLFPLHEPDKQDEVAAFLGASYFRLLGREQVYGVSARGLAVDTGLPKPEEFPRFTEYWIVAPDAEARDISFFALLDSPGLTGAFEFRLRPGTETSLQVRMTLYARHQVSVLGIAPLTSMYLAGENSDRRAGDFRPEVHDSDGLLIETGAYEWIWRPLANPRELRVSSFAMEKLRGFGLLQRDRDFANYQDLEALYHQRPSLWVEPLGDWGPGQIRLLEIPTESEIHDNISAFWVFDKPLEGGQSLELAYRLHSFAQASRFPPRARAVATRIGRSQLPGTGDGDEAVRRLAIDFAGGELAWLRPAQPVEGSVEVRNGRLLAQRVEPLPDSGTWRLVLLVRRESSEPLELRAFLRLYDEALSETWTYRGSW